MIRTPIATAAIAAACLIASPASAQDCRVNGTWRLAQANGYTVAFQINRNGNTLAGTGSYGNVVGTLRDGEINGRRVFFRVRWSNGSTGEYSGRIDSRGRMRGFTFDTARPQSQATWVASRTFTC